MKKKPTGDTPSATLTDQLLVGVPFKFFDPFSNMPPPPLNL